MVGRTWVENGWDGEIWKWVEGEEGTRRRDMDGG